MYYYIQLGLIKNIHNALNVYQQYRYTLLRQMKEDNYRERLRKIRERYDCDENEHYTSSLNKRCLSVTHLPRTSLFKIDPKMSMEKIQRTEEAIVERNVLSEYNQKIHRLDERIKEVQDKFKAKNPTFAHSYKNLNKASSLLKTPISAQQQYRLLRQEKGFVQNKQQCLIKTKNKYNPTHQQYHFCREEDKHKLMNQQKHYMHRQQKQSLIGEQNYYQAKEDKYLILKQNKYRSAKKGDQKAIFKIASQQWCVTQLDELQTRIQNALKKR